MTLLDRFIAKEVLLFTAMATGTLTSVLMLGNVFRDACDLLLNQRIPLGPILEFIACAAPFCLTYTLPWGFLTALFLLFGRMAADRELLVMHTAGRHIVRVCVPVFVIALGLSAICFGINAEINPRARQRMKVILHDLAVSTLMNDTASDRFVRLPDKVVYIGTQEAKKLQNVQIFEYDEDSQLGRTVFARNGWLETLEETDELVIHLKDVISDERAADVDEDQETVSTFHPGITAEEVTYNISLYDVVRKYTSTNFKSLGSRTIWELKADPADVVLSSIFRTEFNKRIALALASLAFVLTGVPIAIFFHRKETTIGFGLGLALACSYFMYSMVADNCRDNPHVHPELLMWLGNVVFFSLGGWMFWRLVRR